MVFGHERFNHLGKITREYFIKFVESQADTVIRNSTLRKVVGTDAF